MRRMYYTYVLKSQKDNKMYTGFTKDLKLRFEQHARGKVQSTKHRRPLELVYYEACLSEEDAMRREKYLKTHYGKMFLKKQLKSYFTWRYSLKER
jgi:putative endonuclease